MRRSLFLNKNTMSVTSVENTPFFNTLAEIINRRRDLYPLSPYFKEGFLQVSEKHKIWFGVAGSEEAFNQKKRIMLMCHGGPGGGCSTTPMFRQFCNPEKWCVVHVDQRGCAKSTPHACVEENTTWDLVADFEKVREHLGIEKWTIWGGSWGSTIALATAITHPERCNALILRGIFIVRDAELRFLYQDGASHIFPESWEAYRDFIPVEERGDFMKAYQKRLFGDDEAVRLRAAQEWSMWEGRSCLAIPDSGEKYGDPHFALAFARIENHYFTNKAFWPGGNENWIYENAHKLKDVKVFAVHGRYDQVCIIESAHLLKKAIPHMELKIAPLSGHSQGDGDIRSILIDATDRYLSVWDEEEKK